MPIYSYGKDSPLKIKLWRKEADAYNRFTKAFFDAQIHHKEIHGTKWSPDEPLQIKASKKDNETYNRVARKITKAITKFGRGLSEDELPEDYLVEN